MRNALLLQALLLPIALLAGCSSTSTASSVDSGSGRDARADGRSQTDARREASSNLDASPGRDAGHDAGRDASPCGTPPPSPCTGGSLECTATGWACVGSCTGSAPSCRGLSTASCCAQDPFAEATCANGRWVCGDAAPPGCNGLTCTMAACAGTAPSCFGLNAHACCAQDPSGLAKCADGFWVCGGALAPGCNGTSCTAPADAGPRHDAEADARHDDARTDARGDAGVACGTPLDGGGGDHSGSCPGTQKCCSGGTPGSYTCYAGDGGCPNLP